VVVDTLHVGEVVDVTECTPDGTWCRIYHQGPDGWVSRSYLGASPLAGAAGSGIQFGITIPLPGGGSMTFFTPGHAPGAGAPLADPVAETPRVCVYDLANYDGANICVNAGQSDARIASTWNNRVSSLRVEGGASIRLCQNPSYGGFCNIFAADRPVLGEALNNKASFYDVLPPDPARVCVYDLPDFRGAGRCVNAGVSDPAVAAAWNDRVSSLRVFGNARIRLCQDPDFGGFCNVFTNHVASLGGALNNRASSYQTYGDGS
jgi:hypothetical protein